MVRLKTILPLFLAIAISNCNVSNAQTHTLPQPGETAPDFQLKLIDGTLDKSLHEAERPMVLFFGSYS